MKKALFVLAVFCAVVSTGAEELNWNSTSSWKKTENGEFTIDYQNKGWPGLTSSKQTVKAGNFYKVAFDCKRDGDSVPDAWVLISDSLGKQYLVARPSTFNDWTTQCAYFPAPRDGDAKVIWRLNPHASTKMTVKNGKFEEVTPEMMKQNLVLNGDFEDKTVKGLAFWKFNNPKIVEFPGKIVESKDFLSGEKSLEMPFGSSMRSIYLPMRKGKTYQLTFWAKGTQEAGINLYFTLWNFRGHKGKHFYKKQDFKIEPDWKEYKFEVTIPTDEEVYPDLKVETGFFAFYVKGKKGKYYLDDISYCEK